MQRNIVSGFTFNKSTLSSQIKPDFLLIRQNLRDAGENYKNLLLGFRYGGVPSVNSIESIYNFQVVAARLNPIFNYLNLLSASVNQFLLPGQTMGTCTSSRNSKKSRQRKFSTDRSSILSQSQGHGER